MLTTNSKHIEQDFKPEVLGRLDSILDYKELDESIMSSLVEKELAALNERLRPLKSRVVLDDSVIKELSKLGYDPKFGARPLNSVFNKLVTRPLSQKVLEGKPMDEVLYAKLDAGQVSFKGLEVEA
jgi:ATP-dependent Clp protease ATP-binding subunit ClpB